MSGYAIANPTYKNYINLHRALDELGNDKTSY